MDETEVFAAVGEEGFARLIAAFYKQVPGDELLGPMYPRHDLAGAEQRLRDYMIYRFGGPPKYVEERGHPRLRMRHLPFPITHARRSRRSSSGPSGAPRAETGVPKAIGSCFLRVVG